MDPRAASAGLKVVRAVWLAELIVAAGIALGLPALIARPAAEGGAAGLVAGIFIGVAAADLALGWWVKRRAARGSLARTGPPAIMAASLVAVTLALTPGLLAAVLHLGFGHVRGHRVLSLMGLAGLWIVRPRDDEWATG